MKRLIGVVLSVLLLCVLPWALAETSVNGEATLTVLGSASVAIVPDYAILSFGVSTQAETALAALNQNAEQMQSLIDALLGFQIAREDMQTNYFSVHPVFDYNRTNADGTQKLLGFRVINNVQVVVRDISRVSLVLDVAVAEGANESYGLSFDSSKRSEAYDQAMIAAVGVARRKAELLAAAADMQLGRILNITDQSSGYGNLYGARGSVMLADSTPIMEGILTVEATVMVSYQLQ